MNQKNSLKNSFSGKKVFITGHTGFQGSWLTLWLYLLGAKITGYSQPPPTKPSLFKILKLEKKIKHVVGDVLDYEILHRTIKQSKPDYIIHLAAQALVRRSYKEPLETFQTNVIGTANVLQAIRSINHNVSCIIMTSDKCYDNSVNTKPHKETDRMGGHDPYSASKGAAELITSSFQNSFFNTKSNRYKISTIRAGNVIGGGDWAEDRLIPDIVRSISKNKKISIRNPSYVRPWQFVLEPLSGILWILTKMNSTKKDFNQAWNLGPDKKNSINVKNIVDKTLREWKKGKWRKSKKNTSEKLEESKLLLLDSTKAKKLLKWKNVYDVDKTISETISWYKMFYENPSSALDVSIEQINNYVKDAQRKNLLWSKDYTV